jgi:drug/metabolite transporter (DMT)-like permease
VRQATRREWFAGAAIGVFFFLGLVLQVIGLATIPASRSGFLTSLTTVFTPMFAVLVFRVFPLRWMVAGAGLAIFGVMVLTGLVEIDAGGIRLAADASQRWTWGDSLTTVGSMFFAVQVLMLDHFGRRMRSVAFTPGMFLVTAILGWLCVAAILGTELRIGTGVPDMRLADWWQLSLHPAFLVCLGVLAFFCSILSFGMMNQFQPYVSASQASVIYAVEPVCASLWALILPGYLSRLADVPLANETLTWNLVLGGVLILAANVVALFPSRDNHDYLGKLP